MDGIGFICSNKFVLLAADKNFQLKTGRFKRTYNDMEKAIVISDKLLIAGTGNYFKVSDLYQYISKLCELGQNRTFDETVENMGSAFSVPFPDDHPYALLGQLKTASKKKENTLANWKSIMEEVKGQSPSNALIQEMMEGAIFKTTPHADVFLFGVEGPNAKIRMGHFTLKENSLYENPVLELNDGSLCIGLCSSSEDEEKAIKIHRKLNKKYRFDEQWDQTKEGMREMIEQGKSYLSEGLKAMAPRGLDPDIVFYELSPFNNFTITEPDGDFYRFHLNRNDFKKNIGGKWELNV